MKGLPVRPGQDQGWGWMIVAGAGLAQTAFGMAGRTMGVYYMLFLDHYGASATATAIATAIPMLLWGILGPVVTHLVGLWSCRLVAGIGAAFMVTGFIAAAYVPNIIWLCFSFSIFAGIGMSMSYAPCFIIVGEYFNKRKALAMGMQSTGSAIGAICGPPMLFALFAYYGFSGTMLVVAGITLHMFIAAALYRPFSTQTRLATLDVVSGFDEVDDAAETGQVKSCRKRSRQRKDAQQEDTDLVVCVQAEDGGDANDTMLALPEEEKISNKIEDKEEINKPRTVKLIEHSKDSNTPGDTSQLLHVKSEGDRKNQPEGKYDKLSDESFSNVKEEHCLEKCESKEEETKEKKKKLIDTELLKEPAFQVILFVTFTAINAFGVNVNFLPAMAHDKGIPVVESGLLLSVIGISDCVCRVPWGLMFDMKRVRPYRLVVYNTAMFIAGLTITLLATTASYTALVIIALIRGSCSGLFLSQRATVLGDLIGEQRVAQAFGLQLVVTGLGTLTGRLLGGLCRDYLQSYNWAFYVSGGLVMLSCLSFYTFLFAHWDDMHPRHPKSTSFSSRSTQSTRSLRSVKSH